MLYEVTLQGTSGPACCMLTQKICAVPVKELPSRDEIDVPVNEMLIVELLLQSN